MKRRMDDLGVSEVVGFILMFALSSIILVMSISNFSDAKEDSERVVAGVEFKAIASRVSTRLVQAGTIAQEWPDAWFNATVIIPPKAAGFEYTVTITPQEVTVDALDSDVTASTTTFRLDAFTTADPDFEVRGTAYSSRGVVTVSYHPETVGGVEKRVIELREGS